MFAITVTFVVKDRFVEEFTRAMIQQARNSLEREEACHQFDVCVDPENDTRIFLYELYSDREAFEYHLKTDHFLQFDKTVQPWLESKSVESWVKKES